MRGAEEQLIRSLLEVCCREDPEREGLKETPARVARAWQHWSAGYDEDPAKVLKCFADGAERCGDEIVLVSGLQVYTKCEHHLADVFGLAYVGYIPDKLIVGLSKFQRLVDVFARRLQVQERLTNQIADCIDETLSPQAVGVVLMCRHMCMESRGVQVRGAVTTTSALRGAFKEQASARAEFLSLVQASSAKVTI